MLLLIVTVINPSIGFIHGFGLKEGALASCVAHDSHNIIVVGTNDAKPWQAAVNLIIENKGGISAVSKNKKRSTSFAYCRNHV